MKWYSLPAAFVLLLSSCKVGPAYHPPCPETPEGWKAPEAEVALPQVNEWWEIFQDAQLSSLEETAVANNPDLATALYRVEEAKAFASIVQSDLFPQFSLNPGFTNTGALFKIFLPNSPAIPPGFIAKDIFRIHQQQFAFPLNLSYDFDLFGLNQDRFESAFYDEQAREAAYFSVLLDLTTALASAYFNLRSLDTSIELLSRTIELREKDLTLSQRRYEGGLVTLLDVENYRQLLEQSKIDYTESERLRTLQENQIALLIGTPASLFCLAPNPLRESPPPIPAGLPSTMLLRRPDIAEAERTMASQHALVDAAYASFFPSFTLTAGLGYVSPDFKAFMESLSRYWQLGVNANQTVYDGGRKFSNLDYAWSRFFEASSQYQSVVLRAFREVEDGLTDLDAERKQIVNYNALLKAAKSASALSKRRYEAGLVNNFEYVVNERTVLDAELRLSSLVGLQYASTVQLIRALGGLPKDSSSPDCP